MFIFLALKIFLKIIYLLIISDAPIYTDTLHQSSFIFLAVLTIKLQNTFKKYTMLLLNEKPYKRHVKLTARGLNPALKLIYVGPLKGFRTCITTGLPISCIKHVRTIFQFLQVGLRVAISTFRSTPKT